MVSRYGERISSGWIAVRAFRQRRHAVRKNRGQLLFDLRDDLRQRGTAIARLELYTVPLGRIMAGSDHDAAGRITLTYQQRKRGRRTRLFGDPHRHAGHRDGFRRGTRKVLRIQARIVSDQYSRGGLFRAHDVTRNGTGDFAHVGDRIILAHNAAPSVCAELDCAHVAAVYAKHFEAESVSLYTQPVHAPASLILYTQAVSLRVYRCRILLLTSWVVANQIASNKVVKQQVFNNPDNSSRFAFAQTRGARHGHDGGKTRATKGGSEEFRPGRRSSYVSSRESASW